MSKRGEISSGEIVGIILAIAALLIALVFLGLFKDTVDADDEACRLSVLARATTPSSVQQAVPLKCVTDKICISDNGEKCDEFIGEKNVEDIKLSGTPEEKAQQIAKVSAEAFYSCWTIMGQGKLDLFGTYRKSFGFSNGNTCVVCSRIAFAGVDDSVLGNVNVQRYMENTVVPNSDRTYVQLLGDDVNSKTFSSFKALDSNLHPQEDEKSKGLLTVTNPQTAILFSQVKQPKWQDALKNAGYVAAGTAVGGTALLSGVGSIPVIGTRTVGLVLRTAASPYVIGAAVVGGTIGTGLLGYNAYRNQQATAAFCGKFTTSLSDDQLAENGGDSGCSLVQAVPYSVQNVNAMCDSIQGNP